LKSIRPQVFISYSREDAGFIQKLRDDLTKAGIDCWIDVSAITAGDRLQEAIFEAGIPQCNLFLAYVTQNYLKSKWCMQELNRALESRRVTVVPVANSEQTRDALPPDVRDTVHCGVMIPEHYGDYVLELAGKAWASLQNTRRLVNSENYLLAGSGIFDMEDYRRESLLKRVKQELILAAPNLRSWLTDPASRQRLVRLVQENTNVTLTMILATYDTLRPLSTQGAEHLRQSAEDIKAMMDGLTGDERERMKAYFHIGATTLSAVFVDPESSEGILFFNPRWAIQFLPDDRLTCVIDKSINSATLYKAIYNSVLLMTQRDAKSLDEMLKEPSA
jgi:hypothetical protein